jgi:hypothetical protein
MTYNLSTVRARIEQKLDDTSFGVDKLNQFINDGQRDILNSRRFVFMEREADLTTTANLDTVTGTPTDMQVPLSLRVYTPVGNAVPLRYVEYEDFDTVYPNPTNNGTTAPSQWKIFNQTITIYPIADATYTLKLKYIKEPAELILDASVPEIPEAFSEILVLAGYKRALEHNDDFDQAQIIQAQIDEQMDKIDERYKRQSGQPHIMKTPNRMTRHRGF